jgi:hypothetical protein
VPADAGTLTEASVDAAVERILSLRHGLRR